MDHALIGEGKDAQKVSEPFALAGKAGQGVEVDKVYLIYDKELVSDEKLQQTIALLAQGEKVDGKQVIVLFR